MSTDPFLRSTFWMVSTGLTSMWIANVGELKTEFDA